MVGSTYNQTLTASGGMAPYSFQTAVANGSLPPGLSLSSGGVLSGTPTTAGNYSFTVAGTDSSTGGGPVSFTSGTITIAVLAPPVAGSTSVTTTYNTTATIPLSSVISGGTATSVTVASGPSHGSTSVSGTTVVYTPTSGYAGGDSFSYTATGPGGTSSPATVSITVRPPALAITPSTFPAGTVASAYSQTVAADGGAAPYSYSVTSGSLPAGLNLSSSGVLSGTPTASGTFLFTLTAQDSSTGTGPFDVARAYTLTISDAAPVAGATSATTPYNTAVAISLGPVISGGPATSVTVASGPSHGSTSVSGTTVTYTPSAGYAGADSFSYTATGAGGTSGAATVSITVGVTTLSLAPTTLATGTVARAYSQTIAASGGSSPYSYSIVSGSLPAGLNLSSAGVLSGTPTTAGTSSFSLKAQDSSTGSGPFSVSQSYSLTIGDAAPVAVADTATTTANQAVTIAVTANDSNPITSIALAGAPGHGSAVVSGLSIVYTPASNFFGTDSFTYKATGPGGTSAAATVTVTVSPLAVPTAGALTITTAPGVQVAIAATAMAQGGPFTAVAVSTAPSHGTATVSGLQILYTPQTGFTGSDSLTYTVANAFGASLPVSVTITVNAAAQTLRGGAVSITTPAATPATVTLNSIVPTGSYQSASLTGISPPNAGTVAINQVARQAAQELGTVSRLAHLLSIRPALADSTSGSSFVMTFTPSASFRGVADLSVSLIDSSGSSVTATLLITVGPPTTDPSADATVVALLTAQADAAKRFAQTQIDNVQRRLESLHDHSAALFSNGLHLGFGNQSRSQRPAQSDETGATAPTSPNSAPVTPKEASKPGEHWIDQLDQPSDFAMWTGGGVDFGRLGNTGTRAGSSHTTFGVTFGADYRLNEVSSLGIAFGYNRETADIGGNGSRNISAGYNALLYASVAPYEATYLDVVGGAGTLGFDSRRALSDSTDFAVGHRDGRQVFGSITGSHVWSEDGFKIAPYGRFDLSSSTLSHFVETSPGLTALSVSEQTVTAVSSALGLRGSYGTSTDWGLLSPRGRLEYTHAFEGANVASLSYAADPSTSYRINESPQTRNRVLIGLGSDLQLSDLTLSVDYETTLANQNAAEYAFRFRLGTRF